MLNTKKGSLLAAGVFGLAGFLNAQVLDQEKLKSVSTYMDTRQDSKTIRFLQFKPDNGLSAQGFFNNFMAPNAHPAMHFNITAQETDQLGYTHFRFQEYVGNVKVEGGEWTLSQNAKGLSFGGGFLFDVSAVPAASISVALAVQKAIESVGAQTYKWQVPAEELYIKQVTGDPTASFYPQQELVLLPLENNGSYTFTLAYKLDVYAHAPMSRQYVYVDAQSGAILKKVNRIHANNENGSGITLYNGTQNFTTDSYGGSYRLREALPVGPVTRNVQTRDMNKGTNYNSAVDFVDADNYWTDNTNLDRAGWSAHWGAEATWDYFYHQMGRNSFDNNGGAILSYVHYDNNYNNAYWDGTRMTYGDGDGSSFSALVSLDVVGHEITHAVTERTSNLVYQNESGALNESFSDIFGTAIEFYKEGAQGDWLIGEDFDVQNHVGFRSMSNPNAHGDPDTYKGTNWKNNSLFPNLADDYGGVHSNSGVQNFWFYILSVGHSGTNDKGNAYSVSAIGIAKAAAIAYRNNTTKLTSNSTFADARAGAIASAIELYGAGSPEEIATTNAWYAVGVGAAHPGGGGTTCSVPAGLSAGSVSQTSATLNWGSVSSASAYNVRYRVVGNATWTNTTSSTNSKALTGLTAGTSYEFQVQTDCGSGSTSAYSGSATFATSSAGGGSPTYCASAGGNSSDEWIARVKVGALDNTSGNNNGYGNFTTTSFNMTSGSTYALTLTPGFSGGVLGTNSYAEYWRIWIDYNRDGDFTDAGEMAFDAGATSTTAVNGNLTVPASATAGSTRMRVQMKYNAASTSCESFGYGEVEDYTVNIQASTPPSCDTPTGLNSSSVSHNAATLNWSSVSAASGFTVEYRVTGGTWTSTTSTSNSKALSGLAASTTYEWKVTSNCGASNSSASSVASFTTSAAPVCGDVSNLSTSGITSSAVNLSWTAGGNAQSYDIRYRVSGGSWVNTTSTSASKSLSGLTASTTYNWEVRTVCSFGSANYVAGANFTTSATSPPPPSYCVSRGNSTTDEWIASVNIGGMSNASGNNAGYANYTNLTLTAAVGSSKSFTLTPGFSGGLLGTNSYPEYWRIWIDYNQDGDFVDAGELVFDAGGTSTAAVSGSFVVSASALLGSTRMRVAMKYNGAPTPCETFGYGEVEDYSVNITGGSAFAGGSSQTEVQPTVQLVPALLSMYPNPSQGTVHITSDASGTVRVYNMAGSLLHEQDLLHETRMHLAHLAKGIYLVELQLGSKKELKKLIIE